MTIKLAAIGVALAATMLGAPPSPAEELRLRGSWWQEPAARTRQTTFVATFDGTDTNADYALGDRRSGGFGMAAGIPGKHGQAVRIAATGGHLHYRGSSINLHHGTLRLQVRGEAWQDETPPAKR